MRYPIPVDRLFTTIKRMPKNVINTINGAINKFASNPYTVIFPKLKKVIGKVTINAENVVEISSMLNLFLKTLDNNELRFEDNSIKPKVAENDS